MDEMESYMKESKKMLKFFSTLGENKAKIILEWQEISELFHSIIHENLELTLRGKQDSDEEKEAKIASFFTQIHQLTKDFKEELDR